MVVVKDAKAAGFVALRLCGVSHQAKAKRPASQRNTQTTLSFLAARLASESKTTSIRPERMLLV
jgi:hypothetical protein